MAAQPTITPQWSVTYTEEIVTISGTNRTVPNRDVIEPSFEQTGVLYGEPLPQQYINQFNYLTGEWIEHLNERFQPLSVYLQNDSSTESATDLSERLGGTWVQRGTQAMGTITVKVWEKTA